VEAVFIIVFFKKQRAEFQKVRVLSQAAIDQKGDDTLKAFEEFRKAFFPYERTAALQEYAQEKQALEKWVSGGPVGVTPQMLSRQEMKMLRQGRAAMVERQQAEQLGTVRRF